MLDSTVQTRFRRRTLTRWPGTVLSSTTTMSTPSAHRAGVPCLLANIPYIQVTFITIVVFFVFFCPFVFFVFCYFVIVVVWDGLVLNNYYVNPICTPSRSALLTAKHPIHTGHFLFSSSLLSVTFSFLFVFTWLVLIKTYFLSLLSVLDIKLFYIHTQN